MGDSLLNNLSATDLSEYNQWANRTLIEALKKMPTQELTSPRVSLFRDICHTLNHMLVIGRIWRGHLEGQDHGYTARNTPGYPTFPDLAKQLADIDDWYVDWARQRQLGSLENLISFLYVNGEPGRMTEGQILQHVVMHNSYHRGYISDFMFQVEGYRAPQMDFSVYCTDHKMNAPVKPNGLPT